MSTKALFCCQWMKIAKRNHLKAYGDYILVFRENYKTVGYSIIAEDHFITRCYRNTKNARFWGALNPFWRCREILKISSPSKYGNGYPRCVQTFISQRKHPWDDAVTLVLTYAEIPFTAIYDELSDQLVLYDWLHLHNTKTSRTVRKVFDHIEMFPGT
jgi:hypothetical protein